MTTRKITLMALFVAIGTLTAHLVSFPVGASRVFPVQHALNVIGAVLLGPWEAALVAFLVAVLRNLLGTGTIFAFPGGIIGALLAGYLYRLTGRDLWAPLGEVTGTGLIGGLLSFPIAKFVLGKAVAAFFFVPPFTLSSLAGAITGYLVLQAIPKTYRDKATP